MSQVKKPSYLFRQAQYRQGYGRSELVEDFGQAFQLEKFNLMTLKTRIMGAQ